MGRAFAICGFDGAHAWDVKIMPVVDVQLVLGCVSFKSSSILDLFVC